VIHGTDKGIESHQNVSIKLLCCSLCNYTLGWFSGMPTIEYNYKNEYRYNAWNRWNISYHE